MRTTKRQQRSHPVHIGARRRTANTCSCWSTTFRDATGGALRTAFAKDWSDALEHGQDDPTFDERSAFEEWLFSVSKVSHASFLGASRLASDRRLDTKATSVLARTAPQGQRSFTKNPGPRRSAPRQDPPRNPSRRR